MHAELINGLSPIRQGDLVVSKVVCAELVA